MSIITIESKGDHEMMGKTEKILPYVETEEKAKTAYEHRPLSNDELVEIFSVSKRTLEWMRSTNRIRYKTIYDLYLHDIEEAIRNKCNPKNMKNYGITSNLKAEK